MVEQTLEFENAHFLLSLFAGDIGLTKEIESNFDVKVTARDAWIKFTGDEKSVSKACSIMKDLECARRDGAEIKLKSFQFAIDAAKSGGQCSVSDLLGYRILGGKGRPELVPRTRTQLSSAKALRFTHAKPTARPAINPMAAACPRPVSRPSPAPNG